MFVSLVEGVCVFACWCKGKVCVKIEFVKGVKGVKSVKSVGYDNRYFLICWVTIRIRIRIRILVGYDKRYFLSG